MVFARHKDMKLKRDSTNGTLLAKCPPCILWLMSDPKATMHGSAWDMWKSLEESGYSLLVFFQWMQSIAAL